MVVGCCSLFAVVVKWLLLLVCNCWVFAAVSAVFAVFVKYHVGNCVLFCLLVLFVVVCCGSLVCFVVVLLFVVGCRLLLLS